VTVSWTQREKEDHPCLEPFVLLDGTIRQNATAERYSGSNDTIYSSLISSLIPASTYSFKVGCDDIISGDSFSFTTLPNKDDASGFSFLAFGDMGVTKAAKAATSNMAQDILGGNFDFVFHNGDISYACGKDDVWDEWFDQVQPLQANTAYMVSAGNHDLLPGDSVGEDGIPYVTRFKMPNQYFPEDKNPENAVLYYSWVHRYVTMVIISTDTDYFEGTPQYKWLEDTLSSIETPWTIVAGHKNPYCSSTYSNNERSPDGNRGNSGSLTSSLEPLFEKYNVDVYLGGHIHAYERTYPVSSNGTFTDLGCVTKDGGGDDVYVNPKATTYMVLGMSGAGHLTEDWPEPEWSARHYEEYGYARIEFSNTSAMKLEFVANGGEEGQGDGPLVRDSVWIVKD
jgi:hypothetical protein